MSTNFASYSYNDKDKHGNICDVYVHILRLFLVKSYLHLEDIDLLIVGEIPGM